MFKENDQNAKIKQNGPHLKMVIENINQLQISKGGLKKLGFLHKYSKQTNCLTRQRNVIQDNIVTERLPLTQIGTDLKIKKESLHLIRDSTFSYLSSFFSQHF